MEQHFSGTDTGALFSLLENRAPVASRTPIHVHALDDETFYMPEGEMAAAVNGKKSTLRPGESIFLPRNVPHQILNESAEPARHLLLCTPSGFENFLAARGSQLSFDPQSEAPTITDIEPMRNAASKFGVTILQDWPAKTAKLGVNHL